MTTKNQGLRNTNDEATVSSVTTSSSTAKVGCAANADRLHFSLHNSDGTDAVWVRLYPAATDNSKRGIHCVQPNESWVLTGNYTGEISVISLANTPIVYCTEF